MRAEEAYWPAPASGEVCRQGAQREGKRKDRRRKRREKGRGRIK